VAIGAGVSAAPDPLDGDLTTKIRNFIAGWNGRKHPFIWPKTPDEILAKLNRKKTSAPVH
jgi:hypothetical protein